MNANPTIQLGWIEQTVEEKRQHLTEMGVDPVNLDSYLIGFGSGMRAAFSIAKLHGSLSEV